MLTFVYNFLCIIVGTILGFALLISPAAYFIFLLFRLDWALKHSRRHSLCPACHRVIPLTFFLCGCGQTNKLVPSEEEIFYKKCSCGKRLPKLPRHGRDELIAVCPNHQPYHPIGKYTGTFPEVVIPIVGGTSTGKSAFLAAWTVYTQGQLQFQHQVDVTFPFHDGPEYATNCIQRFRQGVPPVKTSIVNPCSLGMDIVSRTSRKGMRVFLYDPAGEVFDYQADTSENSLTPFEYYDFMDGVIFVIDPFSLQPLQKKYPQSLLNNHGFQASDKRTEDSCDKFIRGLYAHNLGRNEYHYASCAVVITKVDTFDPKAEAFDLDLLIGKTAVQKKIAANPRMSFEDALDEVCSLQLKKWGLGHVLELLEQHFKEVRCFSVSAFGHAPQHGKPFDPQRVEMPILWLLSKKMPKVLATR